MTVFWSAHQLASAQPNQYFGTLAQSPSSAIVDERYARAMGACSLDDLSGTNYIDWQSQPQEVSL
jgi:hypothetical protein